MPTGYTCRIVNSKKPITLRQYALLCARAFGACVEMREDSLDVPIPEEGFKVSSYHQDEKIKAKRRLSKLLKMTPKQIAVFNAREKAKRIKSYSLMIRGGEEENRRFGDMRAQVVQWAAPEALVDLKKFMLEQIDTSINFPSQYAQNALAEAKTKTDYYTDAIEQAKNDIQYHEEHYQKDVEQNNARNQWLKALRDSLPAQ